MALSANTVLEVRTAGADTNGGGFVTGASGTDWSQQNAAQYAVTDGVTAGTTTITSATANFGTDVVGNLIYVSGGTGSVAANWYQIISRTNSTTIVVDRSTGLTAGTGVTLNIGGALASPGGLGKLLNANAVSGMTAYIKAGTYTITTSSTNVSGGPIALPAMTLTVYGYNATRGDLNHSKVLTNNPLISAGSVGSISVWGMSSTNAAITQIVFHISVDGNSQTSTTGFSNGNTGQSELYHCKASNCTVDGFNTNKCDGCLAVGCNDGFDACPVVGCDATTCTGAGFRLTGTDGIQAVRCLAYKNTAVGFVCNAAKGALISCTAHGNTGATSDGFQITAGRVSLVGCVSTTNGRYGFEVTGGGTNVRLIRCATQGNSSGATHGTYDYNDTTALSGDPYTNSGSDDYSPDSTTGEGASLRGAMPFSPSQTVGNLDSGAIQHADPAGGGASGGFVFGA